MSHLSIALIRKITNHENRSEFKYLVQFNDEGKHMFFDVRERAIGAGFNFYKLKSAVKNYFELPDNIINSDNSESNVEFDEFLSFAENPTSPVATSYIFTLSEKQVQLITDSIETKSDSDDKWKYLKWINESDLESYKELWVDTQNFIFKSTEPFKNPKISNELRAGIRNLVKAQEQGKLVVFAGAGVSVDSLLPSWGDLTNGLNDDLDKIEKDDLKLAQLYFNSRGNKEFQEKVQAVLKHGSTSHNPIHRRIVGVAPMHIITTNFDNHFEQINAEQGFKYSIVRNDSDLPYSKGASMFIKMHGDLELRNIVLTEKDFGNYDENFPLIDSFVKGIFASKLILFVGFSFKDPNLARIRKWVSDLLQNDGQRPYIVFDKITEKRKAELQGIR
jgi:hypothetical protein